MDPETSTPNEMTFNVLGTPSPVLAPRVGKLAIAGRKSLSTPHYIPLTSRGAVPHIAHDLVQKETAINSLYVGLEDCTYPITPRYFRSLYDPDLETDTRHARRAQISH